MQNELEYVGLGLYWNDLTVGQRFRTINRTVTETDLVNFINATGMVEVMFTDATFGDAHGAVKGRPVPGALCYTFIEGLLVQSTMQHTGLAMLETTLKIKAPTFVNDTIHGATTLVFAVTAPCWNNPHTRRNNPHVIALLHAVTMCALAVRIPVAVLWFRGIIVGLRV